MRSVIFLVVILDKWTVFCFQDNDKPSICDPDKYNKSNWTCDDYEVLLVANMGENLSETLKCTGYDVFKDPERTSGLKVPTQVNYAARPKSAISARSARSAVCSKLPSNRKIACRYVTALIGPDQKVPSVLNPDS